MHILDNSIGQYIKYEEFFKTSSIKLKMMRIVVSLAFCFAVANATFRTCVLPSSQPLGPFPFSFKVSGCDVNNSRCSIRRGQPILATVEFIATSDAQQLRPHITAHALGQVVFYDLPEDTLAGCNHIEGTSCPIDEGEFVTYNFRFDVGNEYPLINLNIELRLFDERNNIQFCADIVATVTD